MQVKTLVFDSTPLIYLTKVGLSKIFEEIKNEKLTPPLVKKEVVDAGKRRGIPDALVLDKLFTKGVFKVCEPKDNAFLSALFNVHGLHVADAQVLALAHEYAATAIIDDAVARKTAKIYGIDYAGSPFILMLAICEGVISKSKAKLAINDMVSSGWRCNVESYSKIIDVLEKL